MFDLGGHDKPDPAHLRRVRAWVEEILPLPGGTTVLVTELRCGEPGCPPRETVIALLRGAGDRTQLKIPRGVASVTLDDVRALLAPGADGHDHDHSPADPTGGPS